MSKRIQPRREADNSLEGRLGLVYARVSSKRQEREGNGLESQEVRCKSQLRLLNVPYEQTFYDAYSGGGDFLNRPAMKELLEYIDDHPHKRFVVMFDDLKRFAREVKFHFPLKAAFKARNVTLKCLNYNFDDSPEGQFVELIMAGQAELELQQNKRQVIQKQSARLENGYWAFGNKKGYSIVKTDHGKLAVPHMTEGKLLAQALNGFAKGIYVRKIDACRFLVDHGFWKRNAPEKYTDKFNAFLRDPFYCGDIYYPKWEISRRKGRHKPLITVEAFDLIQQRLKAEGINKKIRRDLSSDFPMRGLIVCAECEKHLTASWSKSRKGVPYGYYFCQNHECVSYRQSSPKHMVEGSFLELLKCLALNLDADELKSEYYKEWKKETSDILNAQSNKQQTKSAIENKISTLAEMIAETDNERLREIYGKQIEKLAMDLEENDEIFLKAKDLEIIYRTALDKFLLLAKSPYDIWVEIDVLERQRLYYFLFNGKLKYSKKEGYPTADLASYIRLFEAFGASTPLNVEMKQKTYKQLKDFLKAFWSYYETSLTLRKLLP
jgi:site-specific DNA recombinase